MPSVPISRLGGYNTRLSRMLVEENWLYDGENTSHRDESLKKRRGSVRLNRASANSAAILGGAMLRTNSGTLYRLYKKGSRLYRTDTAGTEAQIGTTALSGNSTDIAQFAQLSDNMAIANVAENVVTDGNTKVGAMTRDSGAAATVATGAAGALTGAYTYKWAYYSTLLGVHSKLSAVSATVNPVAEKIDVSGLPTTFDGVWDKWRLFRTVASGTAYLKVVDGTTATYTDNTADGALGAAADDAQHLPGCEMIWRFKDRLMALAPSDAKYGVWVGEVGKVLFLSTSRIDTIGEAITGVAEWADVLTVFTRAGLYVLSGDGLSNYSFQKIEGAAGCVARHTVVVGPDGVYYMGDQMAYRWAGGPSEPVGEDIYDDLAALNESRYANFCATYQPLDDVIRFACSTAGSSVNDVVLPYHVRLRRWAAPTKRISVTAYMGRTPREWFENAASQSRVFRGDRLGYLYEEDIGNLDGLSAAQIVTVSGTATGGNATTLTDSGAAFSTTGDGLKGVRCYIENANGTTDSQEITSNTATVITVAGWSQVPASGTKYWVAPIYCFAEFRHTPLGGPQELKRFVWLRLFWEKQDHVEKATIKWKFDGESDAAYESVALGMNADIVSPRIALARRARFATFRVEQPHANAPFDIIGFAVDWLPMGFRYSNVRE